MLGGDRGLRVIPLLVPRVAGAGAYGAINAYGLCEAARQAAEERQHRRGGDLRGGHEAQHAAARDERFNATLSPSRVAAR